MNKQDSVNVFFASDDNYIPYLKVAIYSLKANASKDRDYRVRILTTGLSNDTVKEICALSQDNITVTVTDIKDKVCEIKEALSLQLRDYYSESIYYRLFICSLFPELDRAIYLDSDLIINTDVAKLYDTDLSGAVLGAVSDETVAAEPIFRSYVKRHIGVREPKHYFNSGVLLLDLDAMRAMRFEERFLHLFCKYNFHTVAPDQDYLNFLCRGKVKYLSFRWNKHAIGINPCEDEPYIMHFNMFNKPWKYKGVLYEEMFWRYAAACGLKEELILKRDSFTEKERLEDENAARVLLRRATEIAESRERMTDIIVRGYFKSVGLGEVTS